MYYKKNKLLTGKKLFVFCLMFIARIVTAQTKTIELWPDGAPGSIPNSSYIMLTDSSQGWAWIKNISNPVLEYYPAPKDKANGTSVIICPGGGYSLLVIKNEGSEIAAWLNGLGITAFVLKYRLPDSAIMKNKTIGPLQDAQEAVRIVRRNAVEYNINQGKTGIIGFSAGGHLASSLSTHYNDRVYDPVDSISARPDFSILIYSVISMEEPITDKGTRVRLLGEKPDPELIRKYSNQFQVDQNTPPAFLVHSLDDNIVPVENSMEYFKMLKKNNVPCELHIFQKGGHGYGLGRTNDTESSWTEACKKWLKMNEFLD